MGPCVPSVSEDEQQRTSVLQQRQSRRQNASCTSSGFAHNEGKGRVEESVRTQYYLLASTVQ